MSEGKHNNINISLQPHHHTHVSTLYHIIPGVLSHVPGKKYYTPGSDCTVVVA